VLVEVFAVEDTAVQVCWSAAPAGPVRVECRWRGGSVVGGTGAHGGGAGAFGGGPGATVLEGLPPSTTVVVTWGGRDVATVTTLAPPPGRRLSRFATINDLHIGSTQFGPVRPIWNDDCFDPAPLRCARAAIAEAVEWGADALVVKGDMTQRARPVEWHTVGRLLSSCGLPVLMIEGNHETKHGAIDGRAILADYGIALTVRTASSLDLPGVRIVGVPTAKWHKGAGSIEEGVRQKAVALLADAPAGGVAVLHHYPQRFRYPTIYPVGMPGPEAGVFLDAVAAAHPATLVLTGHSHRHRRHQHGPLAVAEVGSTKDFPGSWAGYTVHEGGIMQTTRRVMAPDALRWTERGRRVLGGVWGVWAPGVRSHRCFSYVWPSAS
jgi:hypothetical protein